MKESKGLSLKYKLLMLLVLLPAISLSLYLLIATRLFEDDKIAYVYDTIASRSRILSSNTGAQFNSLFNDIKPVLEGFVIEQKVFDTSAKTLFGKRKDFDWVSIFSPRQDGGYEKIGELVQPSFEEADRIAVSSDLIAQARDHDVGVLISSTDSDTSVVAWKVGMGKEHKVVIVQNRSRDFLKGFLQKGVEMNFLVSPTGKVILGNIEEDREFSAWSIFADIQHRELPGGTMETISPSSEVLLASYSRVEKGDYLVLSLVEKSKALKAVEVLHIKSILFFAALISLATIISVFASGTLTSTLRQLYQATQKVAEGHFDVTVEVSSKDEVGSLALSFNRMAGEVSRLMAETAEKARMENELATAKTVQETLFPPSNSKIGMLSISGFYEPASECGGDWWHYCEIGNKVFVWIGDATGHGVPAALITSAAKSAASVIEHLGPVSPSKALSFLNRAIFETSQGQMLMTFFLGAFDKTTGEFTYCNASHDPPFHLKYTGQPLKKKDLVPLNDEVSLRLGEKKDTLYPETKITIAPGDTLIFYTDGMNDVKSPGGEAWGERNFIKATLAAVSEEGETSSMVEKIRSSANEFRQGAPLVDDMTFILCRYEKAA